MGHSAPRSTLQYGIAQKCYTLLDRILAVCTAESITLTGRSGEEACKGCCGGKPPSRRENMFHRDGIATTTAPRTKAPQNSFESILDIARSHRAA